MSEVSAEERDQNQIFPEVHDSTEEVSKQIEKLTTEPDNSSNDDHHSHQWVESPTEEVRTPTEVDGAKFDHNESATAEQDHSHSFNEQPSDGQREDGQRDEGRAQNEVDVSASVEVAAGEESQHKRQLEEVDVSDIERQGANNDINVEISAESGHSTTSPGEYLTIGSSGMNSFFIVHFAYFISP